MKKYLSLLRIFALFEAVQLNKDQNVYLEKVNKDCNCNNK